jgi:hypothetical protein
VLNTWPIELRTYDFNDKLARLRSIVPNQVSESLERRYGEKRV